LFKVLCLSFQLFQDWSEECQECAEFIIDETFSVTGLSADTHVFDGNVRNLTEKRRRNPQAWALSSLEH